MTAGRAGPGRAHPDRQAADEEELPGGDIEDGGRVQVAAQAPQEGHDGVQGGLEQAELGGEPQPAGQRQHQSGAAVEAGPDNQRRCGQVQDVLDQDVAELHRLEQQGGGQQSPGVRAQQGPQRLAPDPVGVRDELGGDHQAEDDRDGVEVQGERAAEHAAGRPAEALAHHGAGIDQARDDAGHEDEAVARVGEGIDGGVQRPDRELVAQLHMTQGHQHEEAASQAIDDGEAGRDRGCGSGGWRHGVHP